MPKIIKDGAIVDDAWSLYEPSEDSDLAAATVPAGQQLVSLDLWLAQQETLSQRSDIGIFLEVDDDVATIENACKTLPLIAYKFPAFMDGRGFSVAHLLRDRYAYAGELRAIGHFIRDQLCYLSRCGFNAFDLEDTNLEEAKASLGDLQEYYQASASQPVPLFRRRS